MRIISVLIFILLWSLGLEGQTLTKFTYTECIRDTVRSSRFHEIKNVGQSTIIRLRTYAPCNGNLDGGFEITNKNLNLKFWTKPTIPIDKKGNKSKIIEVADCNCLFDFDYMLDKLPPFDKNLILINGSTLKEIDSKNIFEVEIKVNLDDN